ncbi:MAG: phosphatidate cytidylyltransferase [Halioglobus sp.]
MLKQRIITGIAMALLFLAGVIWLPLPALALAFAIAVSLGAWEWSRLAGWTSVFARAAYVALLSAIMVTLYIQVGLGETPAREKVQPFVGLACLWWSFAVLWIKSYPASAVIWRSVIMRSAMGLLIMSLAWMSAVYLLSLPRGGVLMVLMVVIVAAADIGAYFSGKAWGKHKLAPLVSPAKSWEGFWGGMAAVLVIAVVLWSVLPAQLSHLSLVSVLAVCLITAVASVVGDLTVSMVKRESGAKDSGSLLPGHGGVLDRLDSLCGAAPVFALGLLLAGY